MTQQRSAEHDALDICRQCKEHGYYVWNGQVHMSAANRFLLFILSALCTVVLPAVMVSLYHTLEFHSREGSTLAAILGMIPLVIVLLVCFGGLYVSIFKIKPCTRSICPRR